MKEFIEEYGGVVAACIMGMGILGIISGLLQPDGELSGFVLKFVEGMGTILR